MLISKGIQHKDLKLENILLTKDFTVKILDFGMASNFSLNDLLMPEN